ncbi:hypothetical protein BYT27DRAFT_6499014 [Phlegmacium glaucopus]|nr:hypothetical protein BYT27DRAFT_6499014 [Phlegmacium glaucopus]
MDRIVEEVNLVRREVPKINGSSTAFIVVVVVLVTIIITSSSLVIYLLRDSPRDQEALRRRRYNAQPLGGSDLPNPRYSQKLSSYLWGSKGRHNPRSDKSTPRSGQGWIQTNDREWDLGSSDALRSSEGNQLIAMSEQRSSEFSIIEPRIYTPHVHSPASDTASSIHYDPQDLRGMPYPEHFALSPQATIPSIQSQLCSPTSSSPPSPVPHRITRSPEPIANTPSYDSGHDSVQDSLPQSSAQSLPTFRSGTKFFESL